MFVFIDLFTEMHETLHLKIMIEIFDSIFACVCQHEIFGDIFLPKNFSVSLVQ